jgi:hypothetical protein
VSWWAAQAALELEDLLVGVLIPGSLLRARVGDRLLVNFKNLGTLYKRPHSMHFHGVHYRPSSDGAYVPSTMIARRIEAAIQCTQPPAPSATS